MTKRLFLTIALAQALCFAQKTDFSGTWTLNKAKSNFGNLPENLIPEDAKRMVNSSDSELKMTTVDKSSRGERTAQLTYKLDGTESTNSSRGSDMKSTAAWDGDAVVVKSKIDVGGSLLEMEERFSLSTDRQTMTTAAKVLGTPIGDIVVNYVFEKASAPASVPAFSGTWKLNVAKSNLSAMPEEYRPTSTTRVMNLANQALHLETDQTTGMGSAKSTVKLKLDGTENINQVQGVEMKSVAKLNGNTLEIRSTRPLADMTLDIVEKSSVSDDGRNLIIDTQIGGTPLGLIVTRTVFERQ